MHFRDSPDSLSGLGIPRNIWFHRFAVTYISPGRHNFEGGIELISRQTGWWLYQVCMPLPSWVQPYDRTWRDIFFDTHKNIIFDSCLINLNQILYTIFLLFEEESAVNFSLCIGYRCDSYTVANPSPIATKYFQILDTPNKILPNTRCFQQNTPQIPDTPNKILSNTRHSQQNTLKYPTLPTKYSQIPDTPNKTLLCERHDLSQSPTLYL